MQCGGRPAVLTIFTPVFASHCTVPACIINGDVLVGRYLRDLFIIFFLTLVMANQGPHLPTETDLDGVEVSVPTLIRGLFLTRDVELYAHQISLYAPG